MKIAINATYNPKSGAKVMLINMLKFFQDEKDIFIVIYIRKQDIALLKDYDKNKLKVVISKIAGISTWIRVSWEQLILPFLLKREKVDILFCPNNIAPIYSPVKTIQWIGTIGPFFNEYYNGYNFIGKIKLYLNKFFMIMSARQSDIVIHESQFSQNLFVNKYKCQLSKSKVIHPGKDISFYPVAKKKTEHINIKYNINDTYILCITKFLPYKNIERLIDAFGELKMINTNLSLVIVGEIYSQEYYNEIIEKIEFMNLNKNITILGEIKRQDLLFLYSGCNFLVYTSLYESCGYILMEAMSCGAAICCSNTTAVPEACENAALYFNPYDKSDIAKKMQILINDDNIRKSLKRESLKRAGELPDYAQVTTQTVSIMKNVIIN